VGGIDKGELDGSISTFGSPFLPFHHHFLTRLLYLIGSKIEYHGTFFFIYFFHLGTFLIRKTWKSNSGPSCGDGYRDKKESGAPAEDVFIIRVVFWSLFNRNSTSKRERVSQRDPVKEPWLRGLISATAVAAERKLTTIT